LFCSGSDCSYRILTRSRSQKLATKPKSEVEVIITERRKPATSKAEVEVITTGSRKPAISKKSQESSTASINSQIISAKERSLTPKENQNLATSSTDSQMKKAPPSKSKVSTVKITK
jgi:hypothetical protein